MFFSENISFQPLCDTVEGVCQRDGWSDPDWSGKLWRQQPPLQEERHPQLPQPVYLQSRTGGLSVCSVSEQHKKTVYTEPASLKQRNMNNTCCKDLKKTSKHLASRHWIRNNALLSHGHTLICCGHEIISCGHKIILSSRFHCLLLRMTPCLTASN